jgi:DNA primase
LNLHRFGYKSGRWAVAGLCPFHDDDREGSFKVNLDTGAFKCWSCGVTGGDVIAFVQKRDGIEFIQALKKISIDWRVG